MMKYAKTDKAIAALTPEQFRVTQQSGTERAGTGPLNGNTAKRLRLAQLYQTNRDRVCDRTH